MTISRRRMRGPRLGMLVATVVMLSLVTAFSAVVIIDDFDTGSFDVMANSGNPSDSSTETTLSTNHVIGGRRDVNVYYTSGGGDVRSRNTGSPNAMDFNLESGTLGWMKLEYGLGGDMNYDLTAGGSNTAIYMNFRSTDFTGTVAVTVWSSAGSDTVEKGSPALAENVLLPFLFSEFSGVDFTDVDRVRVTFTNYHSQSDITVDFVESAGPNDFLPEPGSLALVGLGCLLLLRLKRHS